MFFVTFKYFFFIFNIEFFVILTEIAGNCRKFPKVRASVSIQCNIKAFRMFILIRTCFNHNNNLFLFTYLGPMMEAKMLLMLIVTAMRISSIACIDIVRLNGSIYKTSQTTEATNPTGNTEKTFISSPVLSYLVVMVLVGIVLALSIVLIFVIIRYCKSKFPTARLLLRVYTGDFNLTLPLAPLICERGMLAIRDKPEHIGIGIIWSLRPKLKLFWHGAQLVDQRSPVCFHHFASRPSPSIDLISALRFQYFLSSRSLSHGNFKFDVYAEESGLLYLLPNYVAPCNDVKTKDSKEVRDSPNLTKNTGVSTAAYYGRMQKSPATERSVHFLNNELNNELNKAFHEQNRLYPRLDEIDDSLSDTSEQTVIASSVTSGYSFGHGSSLLCAL